MNLRDTDHSKQQLKKDSSSQNAESFLSHMADAQAEKSLIHSQKMQALGSLAGGIVHDFNNVFAAILLQLDLASEQTDIPASVREDLESAKACANRGAELVKRLLSFSRPAPSANHEIRTSDLIREMVALLERTITRRINISGSAPVETWSIKGDENQIQLVIINLCLYCRDAMPSGGKIRIEGTNISLTNENSPTGSAGEFVRIIISDTSAGQPQSVVDRLFEPNFVTKESAQGSGLSLSVPQSIVINHGGWIEAECKEGEGNRFHIYFPRCAGQDFGFELETPAAKPKPAGDGTETVLVADGDSMMRDLFRAVLSYRGYRIVEAASAQETLEKAFDKTTPAQLVILSADMADASAWTTLSQLHTQSPSLPVVLCAGVDSGLKPKALASGASNVLYKPFSNQEMVQLIRNTLDAAKK